MFPKIDETETSIDSEEDIQGVGCCGVGPFLGTNLLKAAALSVVPAQKSSPPDLSSPLDDHDTIVNQVLRFKPK